MPYYEDLSGCSSQGDDSENSDEEVERRNSDRGSHERFSTKWQPKDKDEDEAIIDDRCILHVDVDCFYCQCEMIDRKIPEDRPFAIGQKHIIVTCNYAARRLGIKKLELREKAYEKCPNLLILEGSDLTRYRIHARKIYDTFRSACKRISSKIAVCKGSMDEMMADLTCANAEESGTICSTNDFSESNIYVYGEQGQEQTVLTEDQTGDSVVVVEVGSSSTSTSHSPLAARLQQAALLALKIRASILEETGFRVTMGISSNPLLAKIASGLKKPGSVNLLYPWRCKHLMEHMPIRKLEGAGRRTLQMLHPCLVRHFPQRTEPVVWTCRDLCQISENDIASCLEMLPSRESSKRRARTLLLKCRGVDATQIEDDDGGLAKTVSVENSFRRGTVRTRDSVMAAVQDVCRRLPDLLRERTAISRNPSSAYPTTIRLTVRLVKEHMTESEKVKSGRRRPFETISRQCSFPGQNFKSLTEGEKPDFLYRKISSMLQALVFAKSSFDVTRLNLAATNFCDLLKPAPEKLSKHIFFSQSEPSSAKARPSVTKSGFCGMAKSTPTSDKPSKQTFFSQSEASNAKVGPAVTKTKPNPSFSQSYSPASVPKRLRTGGLKNEVGLRASDIDPAVLEELPPHIQEEIRRSFSPKSVRKSKKIDDFFARKRSKNA